MQRISCYFVVEFDSADCAGSRFERGTRVTIREGVPTSLRGQLYADFPVERFGSDNFVHGSAGLQRVLLSGWCMKRG